VVVKATFYGVIFTAVELTLYCFVFAFHSLVTQKFSVMESLVVGGYAAIWRVIYLQVFLQVACLASLRFYERHESAALTLMASLVTFCVSALFYCYGDIRAVAKLFTLSGDVRILSEGIVVILTISVTWILIVKAIPASLRASIVGP